MSLAMQTRCVWCLREQYGPAVPAFSGGYARCECGKSSVAMSEEQWRAILRTRDRASPTDIAYLCSHCNLIPITDLPGLLAHLRGTHFPFAQTDDPEDDEW